MINIIPSNSLYCRVKSRTKPSFEVYTAEEDLQSRSELTSTVGSPKQKVLMYKNEASPGAKRASL